MQSRWLAKRGIELPEWNNPSPALAESGGLRMVGKWGRGPASAVTGKDTLVVLTLGSEVALLSFAEPDSPRVLSEIQFSSLTSHSYLKDSLLYTSSKADLEVWNIADPTQPVKRGQFPGSAWTFWIRDTFLYYIRYDTLHIVSIANPANLYELGPVLVTGYAVTGSGNTLIVCRDGGFAFVDISDPVNPHEVGAYACGHPLTATARGNLVCASYEESGYPYPARFITLDISTPSSPRLLAKLNDLGGYDIFLDGPLAFVSGRNIGVENPQPFQILSIVDSTHPAFVDSLRTTNDCSWGVWANAGLERAFVANRYDGLAVVDISNLNNPALKTWVLKAGESGDLHVDGQRCYVASDYVGMRLLDVSDPTRPTCISGLDSAFAYEECNTITARDSFAYMNWWPMPEFRTVNVSDPFNPQIVAGCSLFNPAERMVLRDTFVYCAEDYKFQIVNVARPRAPVAVGACALLQTVYGMDISSTLAFVAQGIDGMEIIDVARPDSPAVVGTLTPPNGACGVAVIDTLAYVVSGNLYIASVADPTSPYLIDSMVLPNFGASAAVSDSLLFVGSWAVLGSKTEVRLLDISSPTKPVSVGSLGTPASVSRLAWVDPYLYAACGNAGVLIAETTAVGIAEPQQVEGEQTRNGASVVRGVLNLGVGSRQNTAHRAELLDVSGRKVLDLHPGANDVRALAPGVYFVREARAQAQAQAVRKVIKLK